MSDKRIKKASADDFADILGDVSPAPKTEPKKKPATKKKVTASSVDAPTPKRGRPAVKGNATQTTFYYPPHIKRSLKEVALNEDKTVNDLILEGVGLMFEKRGINPDKRK